LRKENNLSSIGPEILILKGEHMKFIKTKIGFLVLIGSSFLGHSALANAKDLKMSNDSKYQLSFSINNVCSEEFGVLESHSINVIPEKEFAKACAYNPTHCFSKVYNQPNCTGKHFANLGFDTSSGNYYIRVFADADISVSGNEFNVLFTGPWK
jgi:hypothetical protein